MSRARWRRIHKWLAVTAGIVVLMWLLTGIVMVWPPGAGPSTRPRPAPPALELATLSPAEALERLGTAEEPDPEVLSVDLTSLDGRPAYRVRVRGRPPVILDAVSGERVEIDAAMAARIAESAYSGDGSTERLEELGDYDFRYQRGELPIYRVTFDDRWGTVALVSPSTGRVVWNDAGSRARQAVGSLHTFFALRWLIDSDKAIRLLVILTSVFVTVAVFTGYYLAIPRRKS